MDMTRILLILVVVAVMVVIFVTMPAGRALVSRLGLEGVLKKGAPRRDREFLLGLCDNDKKKVAELLEVERQKFSELSEAEIYRRVIRRQMRVREVDHPDER